MSVTSPHADDQPALTPQARELLTIARQEGWAGAERSLQLVDPDTREALIRGGWVRETERGRLLWTDEARGMEVPAEGRAGVRRYRRYVDVEAVQVTEDNLVAVGTWLGDHDHDFTLHPQQPGISQAYIRVVTPYGDPLEAPLDLHPFVVLGDDETELLGEEAFRRRGYEPA